jgi:hypothetical protein
MWWITKDAFRAAVPKFRSCQTSCAGRIGLIHAFPENRENSRDFQIYRPSILSCCRRRTGAVGRWGNAAQGVDVNQDVLPWLCSAEILAANSPPVRWLCFAKVLWRTRFPTEHTGAAACAVGWRQPVTFGSTIFL